MTNTWSRLAILLVGVAAVAALGWQLLGPTTQADAALSDGFVTIAEYENGVHAAVDCIEATRFGFEASATRDASGKYLDISIIDVRGGTDDADVDATYDSCWEKHALAVSTVWMEQNAVRGSELPAVVAEMYACVEAAGVDLASAPRSTDVAAMDRISAEGAFDSLHELIPVDPVPVARCIDKAGIRSYDASK